jgi:RNA polymerase sigma-70 factor (ECF subfamily)
MDDEDLIAAYYACDNGSLETLVERYHAALVGYFINGGLPPEQAEDLAQQVWVRVMNTKHHLWGSTAQPFDPAHGVPFGAWLFVIAHGLLLDALAHHDPVQMPEGEDGGFEQEIAAPEEPAGAELVEAEVSEAIQAAYQECLGGLPAHLRDVLLLELERLELDPTPEQRQWAVAHGFTSSQYTARLHRARGQMRECIQERLGDEWMW